MSLSDEVAIITRRAQVIPAALEACSVYIPFKKSVYRKMYCFGGKRVEVQGGTEFELV